MITMLWKELRENAKWGALALLALLMAEFYAINQQQFFGLYVQESAPLCKSSFLMITTFGCAATGLVLGLLQFLPEQRRDQWAALLHRPVPRATIFRGKVVAGLLLYLIATIVPFCACVWYVSAPGHFAAPFTPRMIFPGVADIVAGAMYYFAALFVSLQRGAWWGTRAFGILAAVSGSFIVTENYIQFYVVLEDAVFVSLILFTAAWGAMLTNGTFTGRPWLARFAALAVVFNGVCATGIVVGMIAQAFEKQQYYFGQSYMVDIDGRPLLVSYQPDGSRTYQDLAGHLVNDPRLSGATSDQNTINLNYLSSYVGNPHGLSQTQQFYRGYRQADSYATTLYAYQQGVTNEVWYYLPLERIFTGFNSLNRSCVGAIGHDGFVPGQWHAAPFAERMAPTSYQISYSSVFRFGRSVDYLDYVKRATHPVFEGPGISGASSVNPSKDAESLPGLSGIVLPDRVVLVDKDAKVFATLPYDHDMDRWGSLSVGVRSAQGPIYLQYGPSNWIPWETSQHMPTYLEQMDLQGHVLNSYTLPPLKQISSPRSWKQWVTECLGAPAYFYGDLIYEKIGATLGSNHLAGELHQRLYDVWGYTKDVGTRVTILSVLLAAVTLAWARQSAFTWAQSWRWAIFVLLFNLAGMITFRLVADWPVRIKCPSCQKKRRIDLPACPHCGAAWPTPARDGTEIVDEVAVPVGTL